MFPASVCRLVHAIDTLLKSLCPRNVTLSSRMMAKAQIPNPDNISAPLGARRFLLPNLPSTLDRHE